ncbi:hypothetical protein tpqmel_0489 [Candidatus Gastranaerophilus sp. (ex Termes propinquus)]|nr:hypothetical protein tpqmel_0489 [Candidatus Gastranaerophilus sp. (ex Termes propinquus)]
MFNVYMNKITQFPNRKSNSILKSWEGFEYMKFKKDKNGNSFNTEHLRDYADKNKYVVSVLRQVGENSFLYDYYVKNSDIERFFKAYFDGKIEGEIIEIEKRAPENLA